MMNYYQGQKPTKQSKALNTNVVLYLGELPPDVDQYELHQFIISHGKFNVESLIVKPTKENKSYAYVKFKTKSEVERARKALHMKTLRDYVIKAEPFKQKEESQGEKAEKSDEHTNLFVKNLPSTTTPKDLYELFNKYGNTISIKLKQNKNGECLGYGYVNYEDSQSAVNALENLNDCEFMGKRLQVCHFSPKIERTEEDKFPLVLIKQIPPGIDSEPKLEEIFSRFGQISFCGLVSGNEANSVGNFNNEINGLNDHSDEKNSKLGVVLFAKKEDASSAVKSLDQTILDESGVPLVLSLAPINKETLDKLWKAKQESYKKKYEGCNLVIKNIPKEITEKNLFEIFKQFGDIAGARIATEGKMKEIKNESGEVVDKVFQYESKGYGFVLFRNSEDAHTAKDALNNKKIDFKNMTLNFIVEYYDYTKADNRNNMHLQNVGANKPNKNNQKFNKKKMGYAGPNPRNKREDLEQNMVVNNRTIINPKTMPEKKVK
jgi:polyadenylate-binding protein